MADCEGVLGAGMLFGLLIALWSYIIAKLLPGENKKL